MKTRLWWTLIIIMTAIVAVLAWLLFTIPAPQVGTATPSATTTQSGTAPGSTTTQPLSARVVLTSPKANAAVGKTFVVAGAAPGNWFFEASFPIKVIDKDGNVLLNTYATAQGDWMTTEQVTFTANITITNYSGPATLALLKDNPSGLPEHDDAVSIPITIQ